MRHFLLLPLCILLVACATDPRCPPLPGGPDYCLQPTTAVSPFSVLQELRIRRKELDEQLIAQLEVDAEGMRMAGLTPMGQRILEAHFDNQAASASSLAGDKVDARSLLSLAQLAAWPSDSVRTGLRGNWILEESSNLRRFMRDDQLALEIRTQGIAPDYSSIDLILPLAEMTVNLRSVKEFDNDN